MENRRVVSRTMIGLHREAAIRRISPFFHAMRLGSRRDYDDVPPLKGVILSEASRSTMRVRVDVSCV